MRYGKIINCRECGVRCRVRIFPSGSKHYVCRECAVKRVNKWLSVRDHECVCEECGRTFMARRQAKYDTQAGDKLCSAECVRAHQAVYPINTRGLEYCRAPVDGGCTRLRKKKWRPGKWSPFCYAHEKRKQRGARMDTPVNERISKAVCEGLAVIRERTGT